MVAAEDTRRTRGLLEPSRGRSHPPQLPCPLRRAPGGDPARDPRRRARCRAGDGRRHPWRQRPGHRPRRRGPRRRHSPSCRFPVRRPSRPRCRPPESRPTATSSWASFPGRAPSVPGCWPVPPRRSGASSSSRRRPRLVALLRDLAAGRGADRPGPGRPGADQAARGAAGGDPGRAGGLLFRDAPAGGAHHRHGRNAEPRRRHPIAPTDAVEEATALLAEGLSRREVARRLTETLGMSRNDAYRLVTGLP